MSPATPLAAPPDRYTVALRPALRLLRETAPDWLRDDEARGDRSRVDSFGDRREVDPLDDDRLGPLDDDRLDDLADEITTLAAHIHAATARLLELIAEFDRCRGWERDGHRSCAHWLAFRTGIALGAAREKVRAASALADLPETAAAMARGELSFSKVRALTRVATPESESDLLELARGCTTAQTERMVRAWRKYDRAEEADLERELHASRTFSVFPDDEGMYVVRGRLPAEVGALLMRAIEAASDAIFRGVDAPGLGDAGMGDTTADTARDTSVAAARRRADALALIVERAMAAGFGGTGRRDCDGDGDADAPISGTRAERYQVMLHGSAETLIAAENPRGEGNPALRSGDARAPDRSSGRSSDRSSGHQSDRSSHLEDGTRVSAETSRRLCCDAAVVRVEHRTMDGARCERGRSEQRDHQPLSIGRRTRTIPPALRRALDLRDRGCRFPGCGLRFTDAHHIRHWADGGETSLANCILLCRHHHRLIHKGGWRIQPATVASAGPASATAVATGSAAPTFIDPRGGLHYEGRWRPPTLDPEVIADAARALADRNRDAGADPGPLTPSARWKRERDIPDAVHFAALEAMG